MDRKRIFTVIALQTTGKDFRNSYIIEIGLIRIENGDVVDRFVSLVDPEQRIPDYISLRTGINDQTVRNAPTFAEIAHKIDTMLQDAVLVGHQISWAYHSLRSEFRYLGYNLDRPKLCTQRLAKKLVPKLFSYDLDKLCSSLGILLIDRNCTENNLDATVILFQRLLALDEDFARIDGFLRPKTLVDTLPSHIAAEQFARLPVGPGVYRFQDREGNVIYVGKAKNIKNRVLSHFQSKFEKEITLCMQTFSIDFEETGNELIALLLEADLIKKRLPEYNTFQKKSHTAYHIKAYPNKNGILQFTVEEKPKMDQASELFFTRSAAKKKLEQLCGDFRLCPKFSGLQGKKGRCDHAKFPFCVGVCHGGEAVYSYNKRAGEALATLKADTESYVIRESGRCSGEQSFVLVLNGEYQGFGYLDSSQQIIGIEELSDLIEPRKSTYHTAQILAAYRRNSPYKVKFLEIKTF